jgi:hypothetical protein
MSKYQILSPDGITIQNTASYKTKKEALKALELFKNQYRKQGFYSSAKYGNIHPSDIQDYCTFIIL